jgi:hypothetical protein
MTNEYRTAVLVIAVLAEEAGVHESELATITVIEFAVRLMMARARKATAAVTCNADEGHPCDAKDGEPCDRCAAYERSVMREAEAEYRADIGRADYAESMRDAGRGHLLRGDER